jgi:decaprenyl-phosphate phosphoribosyltransferase
MRFQISSNPYIRMSRIDHWPKNIMLAPGFLIAVNLTDANLGSLVNLQRFILIFLSTCFASSANYVLNEYSDSTPDSFHPTKNNRVNVGKTYSVIKVGSVYMIWVLMSLILISFIRIGIILIFTYLLLGILYNVKPVRLKDIPYLDVICESANNPIRLLLGWVSVSKTMSPPLSLIIGFWLLGSFLMGAKRLSEFIQLSKTIDNSSIAKYRKSFAVYNESKLYYFSSLSAYLAVIFLSIFSIKYNPLFILFTLVVASWIIDYGSQVQIPDSMVQNPEKLIKSKRNLKYSLILFLSFLTAQFVNIEFINMLLKTTNLNFVEFWRTLLSS